MQRSLPDRCVPPITRDRIDTQLAIDNEETMILWIGQSVSPQILKDLVGVEDIADVDRSMVSSPVVVILAIIHIDRVVFRFPYPGSHLGFPLRYRTSWRTGSRNASEYPSLLSHVKIWTAPKSNSVICS